LKEGEEIEFEDNLFRVEQRIGRRIMRVRLTKKAATTAKVKEAFPVRNAG
jgi:hypothetical protein